MPDETSSNNVLMARCLCRWIGLEMGLHALIPACLPYALAYAVLGNTWALICRFLGGSVLRKLSLHIDGVMKEKMGDTKEHRVTVRGSHGL
jgi:hypothetical protein